MSARGVAPGTRFGSWEVLGEGAPYPGSRLRRLDCRCSCGSVKLVSLANLRSGCSTKCEECHRLVLVHEKIAIKHGKSRGPGRVASAEYTAWCGMTRRCYNAKDKDYPRWGGRGITVCDRWQGEQGFVNFLADMPPHPGKGYSLDRKDNHGSYCPENCRWATAKEQCRNTRRNKYIDHGGRCLTYGEWSAVLGGSHDLVRYRVASGWDHASAVTTPPGKVPRGEQP